MKVVLTQPALAEGLRKPAEVRTGASSLFIGMLRGAFSLIYRHRINLLLLCLAVVFIALPIWDTRKTCSPVRNRMRRIPSGTGVRVGSVYC
jgi:UDP-N-acetylmuramyl pentapeptide phosphotransferase/UDP-N-acetylglucosamine-1-phosphate transferase